MCNFLASLYAVEAKFQGKNKGQSKDPESSCSEFDRHVDHDFKENVNEYKLIKNDLKTCP